MSTVGTTVAAGIVGLSVFSNNITAPTQIPGLLGWYDGNDPLGTGVVPSNGFSISNWIDKSGRSNNASNIGGSVPSYSNNAVYFNGGAQNRLLFTNPGALVANIPFSIFVVEKRQSGGNQVYFLAGTAQAGRQNLHVGYRTTNQFTVAFYGDDQDIIIPNYTTTAAEPYRIWTTTLNNSFLGNTFLNGTTQGSFQHGGLMSAWTGGGIGGNSIFAGTAWYTGFVQEILFYSNVVTATQQQQIEGYLAWKWGLAPNLPLSHFQFNSNVTGFSVTIPTGNANANNAPFTNFITAPTQVAGLQLWLDASSSNNFTLSNSSNVVQWNDRSSNGFNFQTVGGTPTYVGGLNGVFFSSARTDLMRSFSSNISYTANITNLFVVAMYSNPGNSAYIINFGCNTDVSLRYNGGAGANGNDFYFNVNLSQQIFNVNGTSTNGFTPLVNTINRYNIFSGVYGPSTGGTSSPSFIQLSSAFSGRYLNGFINEVLMYSNALTANQRIQIEGYLAWKWGLNSNLPVTHYQQNSNTTGIVAPIPTVASRFVTSSFLPTTYSGLTLWLDANDSTTVLNPGTSNMVWVDKSGTGKNAIVSPSNASFNFNGTFPTYCNAGNIPTSIQFNCNIMYNRSNIGVAQSTFFIVLQNILPFTGARVVFSIAGSVQQPYNSVDAFEVGMNLFASSPVTPNVAYGLTQGTYTPISFATQTVPSPSTNQYPFSMLSFTETNTATINTFTNGAAAQSATNSGSRSNTGTGYAICGEWTAGNAGVASTNMGTFNISEIILYSNVLTSEQRQNVEVYLAWKWGLTPSLPRTHQNVYVPP